MPLLDGVWAQRACVLILSVVLECLYAELPAKLHPVVWMGKLIRGLLRWEPRTDAARLAFGAALTLAAVLATVSVFLMLQSALSPWLQLVFQAIVLHTTFAVRGLMAAGVRMRRALGVSIEQAREALRHLCSRDPARLESTELIAGTVESLVENTCDAFVAPLLYFALAGVPGALAYRVVNTLDSMIGYHGRYEYTGKVAARLDDVLNWVPARISGLLLLLIGTLRGYSLASGVQAWRSQAAKTESPNAGVTMAVAAGLLGVTLEKPGAYRLVGGSRQLAAQDIAEVERWVLGSFISCVLLLGAALAIPLLGARS